MRRSARPWFWVLVAVVAVAITTLFYAYRVFEDAQKGEAHFAVRRLVDELAGMSTALALLPGVAWLARRHPFGLRTLPVHLVGLASYSALHTALLALIHGGLYPMIGLPADPYLPQIVLRAFQELAHDVLSYGLYIGVDAAWTAAETRRAIELRTLRLQLQPHFLFNALNTIAEAIHDAPATAEAMLEHLAELLRQSLRMAPTEEVALADELEILARYTALLEARFGDRLRVVVEVAPGTEDLLVPSLLLQPLVENAVRHGETGQPLVVTVSTRRHKDDLILEVTDDGPGADAPGTGTGLGGTSERLRLLHGGRASVTAKNRPTGGFAVTLRLPARSRP